MYELLVFIFLSDFSTAQFLSAGLNVFNNYWSMVHDFTPNTESDNWSFLPEGTSCLQAPAQGEFAEAGLSFTRGDSVVPNTIGLKQKPSGEVRARLDRYWLNIPVLH